MIVLLKDLIMKTRTVRKFIENEKVEKETLRYLIDLARLSASAANLQSLKYLLYNDNKIHENIFPNLSWAGYIDNWDGPVEGERPSAYIIMLHDKEIHNKYWEDPGIAMQSIMLGASEKNLAACVIASVDKDEIRENLNIDEKYNILYVIALGKSAEKVVLEDVENNNIKYWRDENNIHHVPKRKLEDIILN